MTQPSSLHDDVPVNLQRIRARMRAACERAGRPADAARLVLVTKTVPAERVRAALEAGERLLGESRVQEAGPKREALRDREATWHMIGHLQTNKVRETLRWAEMIQSVDRLSLVEALERELERRQEAVEVLLQVNTSREASKFGVPPEEAAALATRIARSPRLHLRGLMTIALPSEDEGEVRACFRELRALRDGLEAQGLGPLPELSMGMSGDFEWAIEEGATLVRIGTAVFGERPGPASVAGARSGGR